MPLTAGHWRRPPVGAAGKVFAVRLVPCSPPSVAGGQAGAGTAAAQPYCCTQDWHSPPQLMPRSGAKAAHLMHEAQCGTRLIVGFAGVERLHRYHSASHTKCDVGDDGLQRHI